MTEKYQITNLFRIILLTVFVFSSVYAVNADIINPGNLNENSSFDTIPASLQNMVTDQSNYLAYSTFLGGSSDYDQVSDIAKGADGSIYLVGTTESPETWVPPSTNYIGTTGNNDIFVLKLDATGINILYAIIIGGSGSDSGYAITVDDAGTAFITGDTGSDDFPVTADVYDTTCDNWSCTDAFVARVNTTGTGLIFATYLGGDGFDNGSDIAVDETGNVYVSGVTRYGHFPTTDNAYDTTYNGGQSIHNWGDGFVSKFNANANTLIYSTYLGGSEGERLSAMAVDAAGQVFVTGSTRSDNFPTTTGAYDRSCGTDGECNKSSYFLGYGGPSDVFVTKIASSGSSLIYSTFVGSSDVESGNDLILNSDGSVYVVGNTGSSSFPTTLGAIARFYNGGDKDAFLFHLNVSGSSLLYSTFLGGQLADHATSVQVGKVGNIFVTGITDSSDFPVTNDACDSNYNGGDDIFIAVVDPNSNYLNYGTFIGGSDNEDVMSSIMNEANGVYLVGRTSSLDYPISENAYDDACGTDGTCNDTSYPQNDGFFSLVEEAAIVILSVEKTFLPIITNQ